MKRFFIIVLLFVATFGYVQAQTVDTTANAEDYDYQLPVRNPIALFGSPFSVHFAEVNFLASTSGFGAGASYTYLPELWGAHLMSYYANDAVGFAAGATYRIANFMAKNDWHAYAGIGFQHNLLHNRPINPTTGVPIGHNHYNPVFEAGIRVASGNEVGSFSFMSGSLGMMTDFQHTYITLGLSISISVIAAPFLLMALGGEN